MDEVREGLICPVCMMDLGTIAELSDHFESSHPSEENTLSEDFSLKDMFSKAKKRLLKEDQAGRRSAQADLENRTTNPGTNQLDWPEQPSIGFSENHSNMFRSIRSQRVERYTIQHNKLVIRLEKLLAEGTPIGNDKKRREFEKNIVAWVDEELVSRCPQCAEKFGSFLGKRKHHCRLCGGITCDMCSRFVDKAFAQQLLAGKIGASIPVLELRCCTDCFTLLRRKKLMGSEEEENVHLTAAYSKMRSLIEKANIARTQYQKMTDRLAVGDRGLHEAQENRMIILKLAEKADTIAKNIGDSSKKASLSNRQAQLRQLIRQAASQNVKEIILSLPQLPEVNPSRD